MPSDILQLVILHLCVSGMFSLQFSAFVHSNGNGITFENKAATQDFSEAHVNYQDNGIGQTVVATQASQ